MRVISPHGSSHTAVYNTYIKNTNKKWQSNHLTITKTNDSTFTINWKNQIRRGYIPPDGNQQHQFKVILQNKKQYQLSFHPTPSTIIMYFYNWSPIYFQN